MQKKKHRQLRTILCGRGLLLSHGHMVTAIGGNGGYAGGKQFVTAKDLRKKLTHLRHEKALIVKLVSLINHLRGRWMHIYKNTYDSVIFLDQNSYIWINRYAVSIRTRIKEIKMKLYSLR